MISQDESYFGAAPSDDFYAGGFSLIASSTISYGGKHYLAFPGQSGMYETEENAAAVYKKNDADNIGDLANIKKLNLLSILN